jgi:hypothetical protein
MPAKKRCQFQSETDVQCTSAALRIVGQCPHCRAQFCGAVSPRYLPDNPCTKNPCDSIVCPNITAAPTWRTAGSRHSTATRPSWRANGRWLPRWPLPRRHASSSDLFTAFPISPLHYQRYLIWVQPSLLTTPTLTPYYFITTVEQSVCRTIISISLPIICFPVRYDPLPIYIDLGITVFRAKLWPGLASGQ